MNIILVSVIVAVVAAGCFSVALWRSLVYERWRVEAETLIGLVATYATENDVGWVHQRWFSGTKQQPRACAVGMTALALGLPFEAEHGLRELRPFFAERAYSEAFINAMCDAYEGHRTFGWYGMFWRHDEFVGTIAGARLRQIAAATSGPMLVGGC